MRLVLASTIALVIVAVTASAHASVEATSPVSVPDPFAGKGLFTAWDAPAALRARDGVDWVAVDPDFATPAQVRELKDAGFRIVIWQPLATQEGVDAVVRYGAAGYIAQAEGPEQLEAAEALASRIAVPKALVTNNFMDQYPPGWIAMPEAYQNEAAHITVAASIGDSLSRGATIVVPVIGVFHPAQPGRIQLPVGVYADDLKRLTPPGVAAYLAEEMDEKDLDAFAALKLVPDVRPPVLLPVQCGGPAEAGALGAAFNGGVVTAGCGAVRTTPVGELEARLSAVAAAPLVAYATTPLPAAAGVTAPVTVHDRLRLDAAAPLTGELTVLRVAALNGLPVYELYLDRDRVVRLRSPAGGLAAGPIEASTGVVAPSADGLGSLELEVTAQANRSVTVRVNGATRIDLRSLSGATTANQDSIVAGVVGYDAAAGEQLGVVHDELRGRVSTPPVTASPATVSRAWDLWDLW
jgi:hypothetical protein